MEIDPRSIRYYGYLISLSSFLWGYTVSVFNVCISEHTRGSILNDLPLTERQQEYVTSSILGMAWLGSIVMTIPLEHYGRKWGVLCSASLFLLGSCCCSGAWNLVGLLIGRSIIGIACGMVTMNVPCLLMEIAPISIKGEITSLHQLLLTIGILVSSLAGYYIVSNVASGWRYMNAIASLPALWQIVCYRSIPESPAWKKLHDKEYKIKEHGNKADPTELLESPLIGGDIVTKRSFFWILCHFRRPIFIGCAMVFFQAMTGINTVMLYSAKIFQYAGVMQPIAATASIGFVNVLFTLISLYLVDVYDRKRILLYGTWTMLVSLLCLSGTLMLPLGYHVLQGYLCILSTIVFVASFAVGLGAVTWVIITDLIPVEHISKAMSIFMTLSYACNVFVATFTLTIIRWLGQGSQKLGIARMYFVCGLLTLFSIMFIYKFVTTKKTQFS